MTFLLQFPIAVAAALVVVGLGYLTSLVLGVSGIALWFVLISLFMMLVILIQKPKGGGLSGAFGGAGGSDTSFVGAKVGDVLTLVTVGFFVSFLGLAMLLTWTINPVENRAKTAGLAVPTEPPISAPATDPDDVGDNTAAGAGADLAAEVLETEPPAEASIPAE